MDQLAHPSQISREGLGLVLEVHQFLRLALASKNRFRNASIRRLKPGRACQTVTLPSYKTALGTPYPFSLVCCTNPVEPCLHLFESTQNPFSFYCESTVDP